MIGENVYRIRTQNGITLSELAERTGISKSYLSSIERNLKQNPSVHVMEKIAFVLNVNLNELLHANVHHVESLQREWIEFACELQKAGFDKNRMRDYKLLIEFMKWYNSQNSTDKQRQKE